MESNADRGGDILDHGAAGGARDLTYAGGLSGVGEEGDHTLVVTRPPGEGDCHAASAAGGEGIGALHLRGDHIAKCLLVGTAWSRAVVELHGTREGDLPRCGRRRIRGARRRCEEDEGGHDK